MPNIISNTTIKLLGMTLLGTVLPLNAAAPSESGWQPSLQPVQQSTPQRHLPLEGVYNLRDLGGYRTTDGRTVRWGVLFRSSDLVDISASDRHQINALGIKTICDLRSERERTQRPDPQFSTWQSDSRCNTFDLSKQGLAPKSSPDTDWHGTMVSFYGSIGKMYAPQFRALFDDLKQNKTPLLFHCTAGKDRTGVSAALVLLALGVPKDTVLDDYLLTGKYMDSAPPTFMAMFPELSRVPALKDTEADYLNAALAGIDKEYGSLDNYYEAVLNVSAADRKLLRANLLESATADTTAETRKK